MFTAPPLGFMDLVGRKYDIMQQQANTEAARAAAAIRGIGGGGDPTDPLQSLRAGALQAQISRDNAATAAATSQAGIAEDENLRNARAASQGYNSGTLSRSDAAGIHDVVQSGNWLTNIFGNVGARLSSQPDQTDQTQKKSASGLLPLTDNNGYRKGIARVPGKGNGTKDTVKAKLAPGEAVLNKAAAEHMGRGLITALNALGQQKMGMT